MPQPTAPPGAPAWRLLVGVVVTAGAAALGGLMLGEYDFSGMLPWIGGPIFGTALAEILIAVSGWRRVPLGLFAGALASAGLLWAAWISSGEGLAPPPWGLGPGMVLATVAAVLWTGGGASQSVGGAGSRRIRVRRLPEAGSR